MTIAGQLAVLSAQVGAEKLLKLHALQVGSQVQINNFLKICVLLFSDEVDSNIPVIVGLLFQVDLKDEQRRYLLEQLRPYSQAQKLYGQLAQLNNIDELNEDSFFNTLQVLLDIGEPSLILVALNSILSWSKQGTGFPAFWGRQLTVEHRKILTRLYPYLLQDQNLYFKWPSMIEILNGVAANMELVIHDDGEA